MDALATKVESEVSEVQGPSILITKRAVKTGKASGPIAIGIGFLAESQDTTDAAKDAIKQTIQGTFSSDLGGEIAKGDLKEIAEKSMLVRGNAIPSNPNLICRTWTRPEGEAPFKHGTLRVLLRRDPVLRETGRFLMDIVHNILDDYESETEKSVDSDMIDKLWDGLVSSFSQNVLDNIAWVKVYFAPIDQEALFPSKNRGAMLIGEYIDIFYGDDEETMKGNKQAAHHFLATTGVGFTAKINQEVKDAMKDTFELQKEKWDPAKPHQLVLFLAATLMGAALGHHYVPKKERGAVGVEENTNSKE